MNCHLIEIIIYYFKNKMDHFILFKNTIKNGTILAECAKIFPNNTCCYVNKMAILFFFKFFIGHF